MRLLRRTAPEEAAPANPPGQAALAYRSGTQTSVLRRMLARLAQELPGLTARDPDDPAIALLDAWATVADVVTFYQERIVNEGFLRTATERASVLELARAIGYELRPGVAASTHLRFAVESVPGAPPGALVAKGTKVRSVPGQGEQSQTFETSAELPALAELNEVGLRTREPQQIGLGTKQLYLDGTTTGLRPGDAILVRTPRPGRWPATRISGSCAPSTRCRLRRRSAGTSDSTGDRIAAAAQGRGVRLPAARLALRPECPRLPVDAERGARPLRRPPIQPPDPPR